MDAQLIETLGDELFHALNARQSLTPLTQRYPAISLDDAYRFPGDFWRVAKRWASKRSARKSG